MCGLISTAYQKTQPELMTGPTAQQPSTFQLARLLPVHFGRKWSGPFFFFLIQDRQLRSCKMNVIRRAEMWGKTESDPRYPKSSLDKFAGSSCEGKISG